ncbi:PREDICTED: bone marrow stromal antigen 2 isoform X1 [Propithecus coquereli]|uniref:bone marrow stromal antigen 2 isoform X1 n=1 Tax=Propithecus coquereli TaxID=379532 RepID=UPI00063FB63D|nr:PREDICTED: bone marrow stromal antigen 2 isoform X1 [Propithecus coquereli]
MAPTFYHYSPVAMDDTCKGERGQRLWHRKVPLPQVACLLLVVLLPLGVPLVIFAMEANSERCKDGLRAEMNCRNVTHLLELQLAQAQEGFLEAEARATICNRTAMTLEVEKDQALNQTKKLEGEISKLNLKLQDASAEERKSGPKVEDPAQPRAGLQQLPGRRQLHGAARAPAPGAGSLRSAALRSRDASHLDWCASSSASCFDDPRIRPALSRSWGQLGWGEAPVAVQGGLWYSPGDGAAAELWLPSPRGQQGMRPSLLSLLLLDADAG